MKTPSQMRFSFLVFLAVIATMISENDVASFTTTGVRTGIHQRKGFFFSPAKNTLGFEQGNSLSRTSNPTFLHSNIFQDRLILKSRQNSEGQQQRDPSSIDGSGRGKYLLGLALLVCIWGFSIPTEFRRAHWCFSERCTNN